MTGRTSMDEEVGKKRANPSNIHRTSGEGGKAGKEVICITIRDGA